MPAFETPQPITVTIDLSVGDVRLDAGDRIDTVVDVHPSDPRNELDVKAAENTRVEYAGGQLLVKGPKQRQLFGRAGSIDVRVELPSGSEIRAVAQTAAFRGTGRLGECRFKTSIGDVRLQETGPLIAASSLGDISADRVEGAAEVTTGSGAVRIGEIEGQAVIKNSNGDTVVRSVTGDLRVKAANGGISVDRALAAVEAKTANGDIRISEVVHGSVMLGTSSGQLDIGIRAGTSAFLDVRTKSGRVYNFMTATDSPGTADARVEVYASTSRGDIAVRRV
ncbi:DUF4097 family beta strand repeat-containing protein [Streptomyces sp. NPDC017991]|uniref:DUF4097 family beta strand repeat-containing protein n=1 Tax=Streptomyces sp. NPDC017991 TaxID=3365026 RepID=UPI0037BCD875